MKTKKIQKPFSVEAWRNGAKVETRDGRPVRILCTDAKTYYPIVGLVEQNEEVEEEWYTNGRFLQGGDEDPRDLVIVEEVEEPERWAEDEDAIGEGWYIDSHSVLKYGTVFVLNHRDNSNVFATEKQAKSALAMARISQLMAHDERYGGVVTDEEWKVIALSKYTIVKNEGKIHFGVYCSVYHFLAFHTAEQRDLFLKENEQLVKDYLMIE